MVYLSSFSLSNRKVKNPNLYPYNVFRKMDPYPFVFAPITILYGSNGSGKSTILNLIAQKLELDGREIYAQKVQDYIDGFVRECRYSCGEDDYGRALRIPKDSLYMKSEDILFEIKKIQQEEALERGYVYDMVKRGMDRRMAEKKFRAFENRTYSTKDVLQFAQEKYSNGETTMQILLDAFAPDKLFLLDEPEVSLSPENQVRLAEEINKYARFLGGQFIIATHSPFMLGTLNAKIYNLDSDGMEETEWYKLENVIFFHDFFEKNRHLFQ